MEWPHPGSITAARDDDDNRRIPPPRAPPEEAAQLGVDLIERKRQEVGELDKGDRPPPGQGPTLAGDDG